MGITSALSTGLSGLASNQAKLDVVGNNIANVNTVAFKSSRLDFKTQFSESFSFGSAPNSDLGGTNPLQVGMGVVDGAVSRNFADGSRETTGVGTNLAIEGDGFFVVKDSQTQSYTRDGTFKLNSNNDLVNSDGLYVQGYGVDKNFNVIPGALQNINIPPSMTVAEATTNVPFTGELNGGGDLPTTVSDLTLGQPLYVSNGTSGGVTGTAPTASTLLTDLSDSSGTNNYFANSDVVSLTGKVGSVTAKQNFTVTPTSTLGDLMNFMNGTLGIDTTAGANGSIPTPPGAALTADTTSGSALLSVLGNVGSANDLTLDQNSLTVSNGASNATPFTWNQVSSANGESVATSMIVYDSLGTPVTTNVVASLMSKTSSGSTWQFYATSPDGTATGVNTQNAVGAGTISFDNNGVFTGATTPTVTIDRSNTGATPNLTFSLDFSPLNDLDTSSSLLSGNPNGIYAGILQNFSIDQSGLVKGTFSNGESRTLGQVALATFRNNQGLVDKGDNLFAEGPNSGTAVISAPGQFSAGSIIAGSLELSNVDLSTEFVQLISASTGFSAASRVITTSNQLLQELLSAAR